MDPLIVPPELVRNLVSDRITNLEVIVDDAEWLMQHMCEHIGVDDLSDVDVLDLGCGVRFAQVIINRGVPVRSYTGVDTATEVIDFLKANVDRPDLRFIHIDARSELYNPTGIPLAELTIPELDGSTFDLICLFSVFTHLAPADSSAMLELMRRYIRPDGHAYFTIFLNERTLGGHGLVDKVHAGQLAKENSLPLQTPEDVQAWNEGRASVPDYVEAHPTPLVMSLYSRAHAVELIEAAGWRVESISEPDLRQQHHVVAVPVT